MKIASISGITHYVKDIETTAAFYGKLGFRLDAQDQSGLTAYVNWFWIRFQVSDQLAPEAHDRGTFLSLKVVDVEDFYAGVIEQGLQPLTLPEDRPWGSREFTIQDPDGYMLVFFQKTR